jgi:beta propeller repeat protein
MKAVWQRLIVPDRKTGVRRALLLAALVAVLVASLAWAGPAMASASFVTTQITNNSFSDLDPMIAGDRIVWLGSDSTDEEIFTWTPGGGLVQLTTNSYEDEAPHVSVDRVVWDGLEGGADAEIFTWTPGGVVQLTTNSYLDCYPQVSGDRVVWEGPGGTDGGADSEVFTWTPGGGLVQVTSNSSDETFPQVSGDRIVWYGWDGGDNEIFTAATVTYTSLRGTDRYDTALKISKAMFPGALPAESGLVLAPGETFPEALCGAPLASAYGGPVLLTYQTALANNVKAELQRLAPKYLFCIGLSATAVNSVKAALPTSTVTAINGTGTTANIVYDMSRKVANALEAKLGDMTGATAIVTRGDMFPDAIGVSPLACSQLWPIILTNSGGGGALHTSAAGALADLGITKALKVGTYAALPAGVSGLANLSGADRYVTNKNVAQWGKDHAGLLFTHIGLATGDKFPDALASGPYLKADHGILLLSPLTGPLPPVIAAIITANQAAVQHVTFIACIEPVIGQVKACLP